MCERNFKIKTKKEIKSEIENNDLIKTNLYSKKDKMDIKKCYNDFIFLHVFFITNSREFNARAYQLTSFYSIYEN